MFHLFKRTPLLQVLATYKFDYGQYCVTVSVGAKEIRELAAAKWGKRWSGANDGQQYTCHTVV